jgi:hypothetical protein
MSGFEKLVLKYKRCVLIHTDYRFLNMVSVAGSHIGHSLDSFLLGKYR